MSTCPCHSKKKYKECCELFHLGQLPKNAEELMRSRYSAYALLLAEYIMNTTHPDNLSFSKDRARWKNEILAFCHATRFVDLTILESSEEGDLGTVTFRAHLMQGNRDVSYTEKSSFKKIDGRWLYVEACMK